MEDKDLQELGLEDKDLQGLGLEDKDLQEFNLEDIIKEFSDSQEDASVAPGETEPAQETDQLTEESEEDTPEEPIAEVPEGAVSEEPIAEVPEGAVSEEPVVEIPEEAVAEEPVEEAPVDAEPVTEAPAPVEIEESAEEMPALEVPRQEAPHSSVTDQTIRLDAIPVTKGVVRNAAPLEESEETAAPAEGKKSTEPYSKTWEPEYEQPIAEYIPPPPIIFHPRSRLRELKRKLVAGPEKMYYDLSEKGLGRLQAAIFFSILVVLVSALSTAMYAMGMVQENRMRLLVFIQFLAMMVSALLGSFQLIDGMGDLFRGRFTLNTLLVFTFAACCADGVICLQQLKVPCCAAFSLEMTMSLWSAYQRRNTQLGQLDTMRKATRLDSLYSQKDYYDGQSGLIRGEGQVEDFMDTFQPMWGPDKALGIYAIVALLVSIGIGVTAGMLHNVHFGVRAAAVALLAATPATTFITVSRPMAILERRLHALGSVLCGWQGIAGLSKKAAFPLCHEDLFPAGCVKLNGLKFYSNRDPDETVAYTAAMIEADGGSLVPLFAHLVESRNCMHYTVENFRGYEGGGIGGEVNGEPVLVGGLSFLQKMGVETPEGIRINQAVCIAVDGELCGVFAVTYDKYRASAAGLSTLCAYRGLKPVLISNDFMLTPGFIRSKFGVNTKRILFPDQEVRVALQQKEPEVGVQALLLVTKDGLAPFAYGVTGARSLKTACTVGLVLHILGGVIGMGMMALLAVLGAEHLMVPANLFLYQLIWMIPGVMITEWTRTV